MNQKAVIYSVEYTHLFDSESRCDGYPLFESKEGIYSGGHMLLSESENRYLELFQSEGTYFQWRVYTLIWVRKQVPRVCGIYPYLSHKAGILNVRYVPLFDSERGYLKWTEQLLIWIRMRLFIVKNVSLYSSQSAGVYSRRYMLLFESEEKCLEWRVRTLSWIRKQLFIIEGIYFYLNRKQVFRVYDIYFYLKGICIEGYTPLFGYMLLFERESSYVE